MWHGTAKLRVVRFMVKLHDAMDVANGGYHSKRTGEWELQQLWINDKTKETEWRAVPAVTRYHGEECK